MSQELAFREIKNKLLKAPTLAHFDPSSKVIVSADSSSYGLGAALMQEDKTGQRSIVVYASRTLTDTEKHYAQIEKECLALVWAIEKFRDYVIGIKEEVHVTPTSFLDSPEQLTQTEDNERQSDTSTEARRKREEQEDDDFIKSIKFGGTSSQKVVAEEIIEEVEEDVEPPAKTSRIEVIPPKPDTKKNETWNRSIGVLSKKSALANLVKSKKSEVSKNTVTNTCEVTSKGMDVSKSTVTSTPEVTNESVSAKSSETVVAAPASGLTLLANYSGSDSDSHHSSTLVSGVPGGALRGKCTFMRTR
ncbi:uncharacterized protein [Choristoneura fumiferana]|uniref:uncharacterized protein n=1 Tax=Choristoneura fumiferana TaxID=7141 RepID=UPI003D15740B